ncbi:unnamed protein product [Amoebophrya sp. A25]|nr:unnamed protein product [Amoebophrya sp. A25]|eukprot:GSA25T00000378001.1
MMKDSAGACCGQLNPSMVEYDWVQRNRIFRNSAVNKKISGAIESHQRAGTSKHEGIFYVRWCILQSM